MFPHNRGSAKALKILRILGLFLGESDSPKLVARGCPVIRSDVGDGRISEDAVAIHVSDWLAFFLPIDRFNERWEELHAHPDWPFNGKSYPTNREPQQARRRVMRRHPRTQFGTDASGGAETPRQTFGDASYEIYYRFPETEDEYFAYASAAVPPQGRWSIQGVRLPGRILRKVYRDSAARLPGINV